MRYADSPSKRNPSKAGQIRDFPYQQTPYSTGDPAHAMYFDESVDDDLSRISSQRDILKGRRPISPASTASSTSLDRSHKIDRTALPILPPGSMHLGTLRSMNSLGSVWENPCPVHHMPIGMINSFPLEAYPPPPPPPPPMTPISFSAPMTPPPPILLPPMLRPRPLVVPADSPAPPELLPVREPKIAIPDFAFEQKPKRHCCKGNIVILWIILAVIGFGILLCVTLSFIIR